jgi:hypothetical protein
MRPETKEITKRILETALKTRERTRVFRELHETIEITLETLKYEPIEEKQLEQILREIAEMTVKIPCNTIKHPSTTPNYLLNTPNIKIQQTLLIRTIACREVKLHDIIEISTTFKAETIEIETPQKKYIIITNVMKVKPSH